MKITFRMWILFVAVALSIFSIFVTTNPFGISFLQEGIFVSHVESNTTIFESGLREGMVIKEINGLKIHNLEDYSNALEPLGILKENETIKIIILTDTSEIINLFGKELISQVVISPLSFSKIKMGLDF